MTQEIRQKAWRTRPVAASLLRLSAMARPSLTLAALATAAVPGLRVQAARAHTRAGAGLYDAVVVTDTQGHELLVRIPTSAVAEVEQSADLGALRALTPGIRSLLPFTVPRYVGQIPTEDTRAVVTDFLAGSVFSADELTATNRLAESIGQMIAAIHALPTGFVIESGLPQHRATNARSTVIELIGRAADTGRIPAALIRRWEEATDDAMLWHFHETVVNGTLSADSILVYGHTVVGVVGWSGLSVDDPARDLHWLMTSSGTATEHALTTYLAARGGDVDENITRRALLYAELELARWLLHGIDTHDLAVTNDAVVLLDALVSQVHDRVSDTLLSDSGEALSVDEVERLLTRVPQNLHPDAQNRRTDTQSFHPEDSGTAMLTDSYSFPDLESTTPLVLDLANWDEETSDTDEGEKAVASGDETVFSTASQASRSSSSS